MELTGAHLEAIKKAVQAVEYGSVTINISASARTLDLVVENRIKIEKEPDAPKALKWDHTCPPPWQSPGKLNSGTYG
jgi:hypothetical protein